MWTPVVRHVFAVLVILTNIMCDFALGHGGAIDVLADQNGQLFVFARDGRPNFQTGILRHDGQEIVADAPGISVTNEANGLPPNTPLGLDIQTPLLFWDGQQVAENAATLTIISPSGDNDYVIDGQTGALSGMDWGMYPGGRSWEAHGLFVLEPATDTATPGVYAAAVQVTSPSHEATERFILPLVYDPERIWTSLDMDRALDDLYATLEPSPADLNDDGRIDSADIGLLCGGLGDRGGVDLDGNDVVDLADVNRWLQLAGSLRGDANLDGDVEFDDFVAFANHFGRDDASWTHGDFTCDAAVGFDDFVLLANNFGRSATDGAMAGVPEPSSCGLLLWGVPAVTRFRRKPIIRGGVLESTL